ncbi:MarR family winged helix-turn-helix transcriptional regulator [Nocardia rhamnosiphila]|uniref:MarR family winged helix-turn-helix transcriptional regulator n=1 Tax=Nocardia rhamnosiphila TaxID=426716 RepID=UPI0004C36C3A|nr:MarR family transcriptional regulator [Nocardia rhamnosiphila]
MASEGESRAADIVLAESVRWAVSRLSSRLRAEQPGGDRPLTRVAASVLANLAHSGPLTASKLAAIEGMQVQSLTRVLNELDGSGRIRRARSAVDARQHDIVITEAGHEALREHVRDGNLWLAAALRDSLTDAERSVIEIAAGLLRTVAESTRATGVPAASPVRGDGAAPAL